MEDNKNSALITDEVSVEQVEDIEEDAFSEEDEEEYDFNDEDDIEDDIEDGIEDDIEDGIEDGIEDEDDDDIEDDEDEGREVSDDAEAFEDKSVTEEKAKGSEGTSSNAVQDDVVRAKMDDMLNRLGYEGTYEEKMAAYEADAAKRSAETVKALPAEGTPAAGSTDYRSMAEQDLRDINAAFGTQFRDFTSFDDVARFAALRVGGATALEAFRATQKQFSGAAEAQGDTVTETAKPSKDHIAPLPAGTGGGSRSELTAADKQTLIQLRGLYPELSKKELMKNLHRVKKVR